MQPTVYFTDAYGQPTKNGASIDQFGAITFLTLNASGQQIQLNPAGGVSVVGIFANTTLLQAAFPAASYAGSFALIGTIAPFALYTSNGTAWVAVGSGGGGGSSVTPIQITASRALLTADNGAVLYTVAGDSGSYALTVPTGLGNFSCTIIQLGTNPISCSNGVGVTMAVTGSTAGVNTAMALVKADATAEIYDLFLPAIVPAKAGTQTVYPGTDNTAYLTALTASQLIALVPTVAYPYIGLSTGTLPSSPTDGEVILLTDTAWGGSGTTSGSGAEWVWKATPGAWFPKNTIEIVTINSTAGVTGVANATQQYLAQYQLPAIVSKMSQQIKVEGIVGKTGTAGTLTFTARLGNTNSSGPQMFSAIVATATQIKGYFQGDIIFDSATSFHEVSGGSLVPTTAALVVGTGLTAAASLWINMQLTPVSTDTPIVYGLNIKLLPYGGA